MLTLNKLNNEIEKTRESARTGEDIGIAQPSHVGIEPEAWQESAVTSLSTRDIPPHVQEKVFEGGDGYIWGLGETTGTLDTIAVAEAEYLRSSLTKSLAELDESRRKESRLRRRIEEYLSALTMYEAVATSNEMAMSILCRLDELGMISEEDLSKDVRTSGDWLAVAWLMKAGFVDQYGSELRITDRGQQIVRAIKLSNE